MSSLHLTRTGPSPDEHGSRTDALGVDFLLRHNSHYRFAKLLKQERFADERLLPFGEFPLCLVIGLHEQGGDAERPSILRELPSSLAAHHFIGNE